MTTLKPQSSVTVPSGGSAPGLKITYHPARPAAQTALQCNDAQNAPIFFFSDIAGASATHYENLAASNSVFASSFMELCTNTNLYTGTPGMNFPDGTGAQGLTIFAGTGVPSNTTIHSGGGQVGDLYIRRDGWSANSNAAGKLVYQCTVAGTPGTWVAIK